jgi:hypothetical protein
MRLLLLSALVLGACKNTQAISVERARGHAVELAKVVDADVAEVRSGLRAGEAHLHELYAAATPARDNVQEVRSALELARHKTQDLRVAKVTFLALLEPNGTILRNDQDQDLMAGKNAFEPFPELRQAASGRYVETRGSMAEAAGVKGIHDAQWVAAQPVTVAGEVKGIFVGGWSWSSYAYRLEFFLRSKIRSETTDPNAKLPLAYVYVVVGDKAYGAPVSPQINAEAIQRLSPLSKLQQGIFATPIEITDREFGLAVTASPALGPNVGVAVLRSET